ncbi:hypothetical protein EXIGLDRAFT_736383 [Exidia glandulosa HHB12029]|uniref:Uncharacterized protein n=1 Tax=Exidia glandulosa HHB12029 TaxID=1314781 RepID=A0A165JG28_EXIGL|nr:hypothetical protein EXIGLDRAFT_736383 [Exidia glandulosa HHB12029]
MTSTFVRESKDTTALPASSAPFTAESLAHYSCEDCDSAARYWAVGFLASFATAGIVYSCFDGPSQPKLLSLTVAPISAVGVCVMAQRGWPQLNHPNATSVWIILSGAVSVWMLFQYIELLETSRFAQCSATSTRRLSLTFLPLSFPTSTYVPSYLLLLMRIGFSADRLVADRHAGTLNLEGIVSSSRNYD